MMCEQRLSCSTSKPEDCLKEAVCVPKKVHEYYCSRVCPLIMKYDIPQRKECGILCKPSQLVLCLEADCKDDEYCHLENIHCPENEVCKTKAMCVKNTCGTPSYCGLECSHGLKRDDPKCPSCECIKPTCEEIQCKENYQCIEETVCKDGDKMCYNYGKCVPANCNFVQCNEGFMCMQKNVTCDNPPCKENLPKCVLETCDLIECGPTFKCVQDSKDCGRSSCPKCIPIRDCSEVSCDTGDVCEMVTPECPSESSDECASNSSDCNKDCEKPYAQCVRDCKNITCPDNCQFGCMEDKDGCMTDFCSPPSNCDQIECKSGEKCEIIAPDCDSDTICTDMLAKCVKHCPEIDCTLDHSICEWGMKKDDNNCPKCECQIAKSCDQIKCHVDDRCLPSKNSVGCEPCGLVEGNCKSGEEQIINEDGCLTGFCAPSSECEKMDCPEGKDCQMMKKTCDGADCKEYEPKCMCQQQECRMFCEYGFKTNPANGCEICQCNERLPSCDNINCPKGQQCVMSPAVKGSRVSIQKPVCRECPNIGLCPTCPENHNRIVDENGCETCDCKPVCSTEFCDLDCELAGFKVDENGCQTCICNPTTPCKVSK